MDRAGTNKWFLVALAALSGCARAAGWAPASDGGLALPAECTGRQSDGGAVPARIPVVRVRGRITLNAMPLPATALPRGAIRFVARDATTSSSVELGRSATGAFDLRMPRGVYDVEYVPLAWCETGLPFACTRSRVVSGVVIDRETELEVPLESVRATIALRLSTPQSSFPGNLVLFNELGESARISAGSLPVTLPVAPATYSVALEPFECSLDGPWPCGPTTIARGLSFTDGARHELSVSASRVDFSLSRGGFAWPLSATDRHALEIVDGDGHRVVARSRTDSEVIRAWLGAGHYVARYFWDSDEPCDPQRSIACVPGTIAEFDVSAGEQRLALDVATVSISGRVTIDGAAPIGAGVGREGMILVRRGDQWRRVRINPDGEFSFRVVKHSRGALSFDADNANCESELGPAGLACGGAILADEHEFAGDERHELALRSRSKRVDVSIDGRSLGVDPSRTWSVQLASRSGAAPVQLRLGSRFAVRLIEGEYAAVAQFGEGPRCAAPDGLPCGSVVLDPSVSVRSDDALVIAARTRVLSGPVLLNDAAVVFDQDPALTLFVGGSTPTRARIAALVPVSYAQRTMDLPWVGHLSRLGQCSLDRLPQGSFCGSYWFFGCP